MLVVSLKRNFVVSVLILILILTWGPEKYGCNLVISRFGWLL